ncbi:MAG: DLW-39 family protein [Nocardioidaceae bacterium]
MKKIIALVIAAAGVFWAVNKSKASKAESDLWAEASDSVRPQVRPGR